MKNIRYVFIGLVFSTIFVLAFSHVIVESKSQWEYLEWDVPEGVEYGDIMFTRSPLSIRYLLPYRDDGHYATYIGNNTLIHAIGGPDVTDDGIKTDISHPYEIFSTIFHWF